jgi:hypothetical protein
LYSLPQAPPRPNQHEPIIKLDPTLLSEYFNTRNKQWPINRNKQWPINRRLHQSELAGDTR